MDGESKTRILVVDDELSVRASMSMLLGAEGYDVSTAEDGFDALLQLSRTLPTVAISDLNMPKMSGFELLSVLRRRFPEISVIAISGAYESGDSVPNGVITDVLYPKGRHHPTELLRIVADLIRSRGSREVSHYRESAPVWIPRDGKDSKGEPFIVLTCTQCLRSFPLSVQREVLQEVQVTACIYCDTHIRYIMDFSRDVASPKASDAYATAEIV